jgi:hypothetical protein
MGAGDHISVGRKRLGVTYYHHGIDIGNDRAIHLTGDNKRNAKVVETSVLEFLDNGKKEIIDYTRFIDVIKDSKKELDTLYGRDVILPPLDDDTIIKIEQRIASPENAVNEAKKYLYKSGYDLFTDNCEHFAVFCKTGLKLSLQVIELHKFSKKAAIATCPESNSPFKFPKF